MQVLVDTFFANEQNGHGGQRRAAQIAELVEQANLEIVYFEREILQTPLQRRLAGLSAIANPKTFLFIAKHHLNVGRSLNELAFCGFQRQLYDRVLAQHSETGIFLWEATKNYVASYLAKEKGFKVLALPHNVESLVLAENTFHGTLSTEIQALAAADIVFCISREETWLLRLNGANAYYLPYYPPRSIVDSLLKIRQVREKTSKNRFLILGSAGNEPTRQGMIEQIAWLKQIRQQFEFQVDIVGYRTESLKEYADRDFIVQGTVSSEQLETLLIQAKAALIHQTPSSGALTRIPELLIAGVPVIANLNACRSAQDYGGVYCYDDPIELLTQMTRSLFPPAVLERPLTAEKQFIQALYEFSQSEKSSKSST